MINTGSITITPELLVFIAEVDEFKGALRALGMRNLQAFSGRGTLEACSVAHLLVVALSAI
jgi:hypothetical protein